MPFEIKSVKYQTPGLGSGHEIEALAGAERGVCWRLSPAFSLLSTSLPAPSLSLPPSL